MKLFSRMISTLLMAVGLASSSLPLTVPAAVAAPRSASVSCTMSATVFNESPGSTGYDVFVMHKVTCNQAVEQIKVYATDYKEGYETTSKFSGTYICSNTDTCQYITEVFAQNCPRGWYRVRTSADIGTASNPRAYGSLEAIQQRIWWESVCYP